MKAIPDKATYNHVSLFVHYDHQNLTDIPRVPKQLLSSSLNLYRVRPSDIILRFNGSHFNLYYFGNKSYCYHVVLTCDLSSVQLRSFSVLYSFRTVT